MTGVYQRRRVGEDICRADFARIPQTTSLACVVRYRHLSHPSPRGLVVLNLGCSQGGALFSWVLLFLLEKVQKNLKADFLAYSTLHNGSNLGAILECIHF